jgi:conjugal transfer ATP-binding protein TraC
VLDCLSQYGNLRVEDADQGEKAKHYGRPARNTNLYRTLARRRVTHLLQGAHSSLTKGYHYTVRDFKLSLSVCVAGSIDNMTMRENLLQLRESISTTLRAASFPNRVCTANDLINWWALFCNPHRIEAPRLTPLHYDDGREIRDQIIDFDTLQEAKPLGLVFTKPGRDEAVEARFYSIKSFPERFALWQMNGLIGDLMQPALQYSCHRQSCPGHTERQEQDGGGDARRAEEAHGLAGGCRHARPGRPDRQSLPPARDLHPAKRGHRRRRERQSDLAQPRL